MARIRIRIEAVSINDPYWREHAKGIDQPLDGTGHWRTNPKNFWESPVQAWFMKKL